VNKFLESRVRGVLEQGLSRRTLLRGTTSAAAVAAVAGPLGARIGRAQSVPLAHSPDYGPLRETLDLTTGQPLLALPQGFRYRSFGWTGDLLQDGSPTPAAHDGMAVVHQDHRRVVLVRNHEVRRDSGVFSPAAPSYDPAGGGGTTNLEFRTWGDGEYVRSWASLTGTITNCAGGPTPWGSWLTCEEDTRGPSGDPTFDPNFAKLTKTHGWVFDVPAFGTASGRPIEGMGRFSHEATATDPRTLVTYLTEDVSVSLAEDGAVARASGFYRFVPEDKRRPTGDGRLQMLAIKGQPKANLSANTAPLIGNLYDVEWVDIADPTAQGADGNGVFQQGWAAGGAAFQRLEGAWYSERLIFFVSTSGGPASLGAVWVYDLDQQKLWALFESNGASDADYPDNITVSPRGGLLMCEDGDAGQYLLGLTRDGYTYRFARNIITLNGDERNDLSGDFSGSEFAGATWDRTGKWLFVNIQTPGITLAITGPWARGSL
jgi:uncharacterized protein